MQDPNQPVRNYTVQTKIARPVGEVFDAIINKSKLQKYFVDEASGPLMEGQRILWRWSEWGDYPVVVKRVIQDKLIELELDCVEWKKQPAAGYCVLVTIEFERLSESATILSISESGWLHDVPGYKASHENCSGWTHMSMCLKAYLEYGLDLRAPTNPNNRHEHPTLRD